MFGNDRIIRAIMLCFLVEKAETSCEIQITRGVYVPLGSLIQ